MFATIINHLLRDFIPFQALAGYYQRGDAIK